MPRRAKPSLNCRESKDGFIDRLQIFDGDLLLNVGAYDVAMVDVFGGSFPDGLFAHDNGQIHISGGELEKSILAFETSEITVSGSGFNYPLGPIAALSGTLTGLLSDGTPIDIDFGHATTASITCIVIENPIARRAITYARVIDTSKDMSGIPDDRSYNLGQ